MSIFGGGGGGGNSAAEAQAADEARKAAMAAQVRKMLGLGDDADPAAVAAHTAKRNELTTAARQLNTDDLSRKYTDASRQQRFALADRGLTRSSVDAETMGDLARDHSLGVGRIEETVRGVGNAADQAREQALADATLLIRSGGGEDAARAAQASVAGGIGRIGAENNMANLTDLFSNASMLKQYGDTQNANATLAERFRSGRLRPVNPTSAVSVNRGTV